MKIIVACDSFKGSVTSREAGEAVSRGVHSVIPAAEIIVIPMADGGEGTSRIMTELSGGTEHHCIVRDPLGNRVRASYGIAGTKAIIEMAEADGLTLIPAGLRNPAITSSYGTGELILDAVRHGCTELIICLGGSATNDGGAGMLQALGWQLLDAVGCEIGAGGLEAGRLARIDDSNVSDAVRRLDVTIACDVTAPLTGPEGASYTFAPQKGASRDMLPLLDVALSRYASVVSHHAGVDCTDARGAGAAGGLGFALMALMGGKMVAGAELVLDMAHFDERLINTDLVITGEGRLDMQTLMGKAPSVVLDLAMHRNIPVTAIAGAIDPEARIRLREAGFTDVCAVSDPALPLEEAMHPAVTLQNIEATVRERLPQWLRHF